MIVLSQGTYTGNIANKMIVDDVVISTTQYSRESSRTDWHCHENPHISFVFQGGESGLHSQRRKKNCCDLFYYRAGEMHCWESPTPVSVSANIEIGILFAKKYNLTEIQLDNAVRDNLDLKFLMLKMQQEMSVNDIDSFATIETLLLELVGYANSLYEGEPPSWVRVVHDLINDRWNQRISLQELSIAADVHPVTVSKYFRKYFACTLGEYLRKQKIQRSISFLKNSSHSLTEIAFHCGFSDQSHFSRTFKQLTGLSPKAFRNL